MGTLGSADCNTTGTLSTASPLLGPNSSNASLLCGPQVYRCLPIRWLGTCALLFPFPKVRVVPGEEPLLIPITRLLAAQHEK